MEKEGKLNLERIKATPFEELEKETEARNMNSLMNLWSRPGPPYLFGWEKTETNTSLLQN